MRIIYNNHFPFGSYRAINMFGVIWARRQYGELEPRDCNHEFIHTLQQREMLFVFFYVWYVIEWGIKFCIYRDLTKAYFNIGFEREAYRNERNLDYKRQRPFWAWLKYLRG